MDQKKIGTLLRELRLEAGITQEDLANEIGVSNRSVSRWERGTTMPDFDLLIEMAKRYDISVDEILAGERRAEMERQTEETLYRIADYTNNERDVITKRMHVMFIAGIVGFVLWSVLEMMDLADTSPYDFIAGVGLGIAAGMTVVGAIFTSRYGSRLREAKLRMMGKVTGEA